MPSDPIRPPDSVLRDQNAARDDSVAPAGMAEARHPFPRAIGHAEETGSRGGEWWSLVKAILVLVLVLAVVGWLISG